MKKLIFILITATFIFVSKVYASSNTYPISSLGSCRNAAECYSYCQVPTHHAACWSYGKFVLHQQVLGETATSPAELARQHGITFPIAELGNCASISACMAYCDQPSHYDACSSFGQKKGLTQNNSTSSINQQKVLQDAQTYLGCNDENSCRAFCSQPANYQKCQAFASREDLNPPTPSVSLSPPPLNPTIQQAAEEQLGCNSISSCMQFCNISANFEKCQEFAKEHELESENDNHPPSIYPSYQQNSSSYSYSSWHDNSSSFPNYQGPTYGGSSSFSSMQGTNGYTMPGGCTDEQSCYQYCQAHPSACPGFQNYSSSSSSYSSWSSSSYSSWSSWSSSTSYSSSSYSSSSSSYSSSSSNSSSSSSSNSSSSSSSSSSSTSSSSSWNSSSSSSQNSSSSWH